MTATAQQLAILDSLHGALRITAGAGTGKTDTLRRAIVKLIEDEAKPGEILCLTFTVDATEEMRRRVVAAFEGDPGLDADEITVQTYHAFAASIVHEHALLAGLDGPPNLIDQARKWQLILAALDDAAFDHLAIGWLPSFIKKLLDFDDEIQRNDLSLEQVADWCRPRVGDDVIRDRLEATGALALYAERKRDRNAIDFGDQIRLANELLRRRPEILERLRSHFRYVFLDEYQDTDVAQRELVKLVGTGAEFVCAVGDVDQGVFGWRGATIHNMFAFPEDFPGARTLPLSLNFRSGGRILELANAMIDGFTPPPGYEREPLTPQPDAPAATIEGFVAPHSEEEAETIAELIAAAGAPWDRYAVLVRKRSQLDPLFRALTAAGVPVEVDTLGGFWSRPEILDVVAWLHLLADAGDNIALARILLGPAYKLDRRDLFFVADHAKGERREQRRRRLGDRDLLPYAIVDAVVAHEALPELTNEASERVASFRETWCELAATAERVSLADLVGEIARISGLAAELEGSQDPEATPAMHHIAKLRDLAQGYQPVAGSADLAGFVHYLDSIEESDQDEDALRAVEENAVRLMTIHRAKGLEWDTVFVPGLAYNMLPTKATPADPTTKWQQLPTELRGDRHFVQHEDPEDEDRRLMYVAVTRAKRRLVLSRPWFFWGNKNSRAPSVFWDEALDTGLVHVLEEAECPLENPHPESGETVPPMRPPRERVRDEEAIARIEPELERLRAVHIAVPRAAPWRCPSTISVTALLTFIRDEDEFFWRYVRRAPSPPSPAAQLGIEVHRRIEEHARGAVALGAATDDEEPYDLDPGERRGDGQGVSADRLWQNFLASRFARMTPLMTEQPFTLYVGAGLSVTGRIDAIFEREDGTWEVVDYKTGASDPDSLQLAIYSRAIEEIWGRRAAASWLLIRDGSERGVTDVPDLNAVISASLPRLRVLDESTAAA